MGDQPFGGDAEQQQADGYGGEEAQPDGVVEFIHDLLTMSDELEQVCRAHQRVNGGRKAEQHRADRNAPVPQVLDLLERDGQARQSHDDGEKGDGKMFEPAGGNGGLGGFHSWLHARGFQFNPGGARTATGPPGPSLAAVPEEMGSGRGP
jgi:hypothetical protein